MPIRAPTIAKRAATETRREHESFPVDGFRKLVAGYGLGMPSLGQELTERLRDSKFGRDVFGPKIARPTARWLHEHFVDDIDGAGADDQVADDKTPDEEAATQAEVATIAALPVALPDVAVDEELGELDLTPTTPKALLGLIKELGKRVKNHNLVVVAAGIAFWGLLAIPATLFAVVSIAGLLLDADTVKQQVEDNLSGLPEEAQTIIGDQLASVSGGSTGGLIAGLIVGLVLAFWTASGAMAKLMGALNTIYDTVETRNFAKLRGTAVLLTFGGIIFISSAIFLLAAMPPILSSVDAVGDGPATLFVWLRFPILGLVMIIALGVLYYIGPDRKTKYRPVTAGAAVAMALWIGLSALFTIYTSTVGSYNETYGSIGGIVILLLWLFITAFVVLLGAEIHAQRETDAKRHLD